MSNIICPYCGKKLPDERFGCCDESSGHMMNITEAFEKQQKLCHGLGVPCFVLEECPMCGEFIFDDYVTFSEAGERMITGCPHCNYSFVE